MATKIFLSPLFILLAFLVLVQITGSSEAGDDIIGVYWRLTSDNSNLTEACATGKYTYVVIFYLLMTSPGEFSPQLLDTPAGICSGPPLSCPTIGTSIKYCQQQGIKVMLYVAGEGWNVTLSSADKARSVSDYLWNTFLGGNSSSRPFGDAILDGVNFDIRYSTPYWKDLALYLKSHSSATRRVLLSASPQCRFPDNFRGTALEEHRLFDYVYIQFQGDPACKYSVSHGSDSLLNTWNQWTKSLSDGGSKVLLYLPASENATDSGFIPSDELISDVLPFVRKSPNYGGVMLWMRDYDAQNNYSDDIKLSSLCTELKNASACGNHDNIFEEQVGNMSAGSSKIYESLPCCQTICKNNCSCVAYAPVNSGRGCQIWLQGATFTAGAKGQSIYVLAVRHKGNRWWIWLITGVGSSIALFLICYLSLRRKHKAEVVGTTKQRKILHDIGGSAMIYMAQGKAKRNQKHQIASNNNEVEIFSFESIAVATNNFSFSNKLGEGGFGPVYKGTLTDGQEVAIKRLAKSSGQGLTEFKNEAKLMAQLQHTNLVRLIGFCIQRDERILVYEYMSNKSLDYYLFDEIKRHVLGWGKRFNIIEGIAQGLLYLHKYSRLKVVHRDLKAGNILLDEEMNPKISDFGMARIFGPKGYEESTNRVVGTYGYMAPEYAMNGVVSIKIDVFSFGVLLLEILSGKKNNSRNDLDGCLNLIGYAWRLWNEDRPLELMDSELSEPNDQKKVLRGIHIGLLCVQDQAVDRPFMVDVISFLSNDTIQLGQPKKPAFFSSVVEEQFVLSNSNQELYSINCVTMSNIDGR
ncbi:G-type lectin S-receptor-like serine/threonine-protein kinase CES101 [Prosopis cineraria]|uniref:G-type lectin S-receptor-like serine/threonine-protein kinase CES101 n=1 Tax=Prosopis cineraria TaxID=364024 RepID=UPI00240F088D|nr:G-type lectin S-receptor-like serine/threonine-protein kinase CES101 [Prosopis cineraria]